MCGLLTEVVVSSNPAFLTIGKLSEREAMDNRFIISIVLLRKLGGRPPLVPANVVIEYAPQFFLQHLALFYKINLNRYSHTALTRIRSFFVICQHRG